MFYPCDTAGISQAAGSGQAPPSFCACKLAFLALLALLAFME